jgi:hypothetical protein
MCLCAKFGENQINSKEVAAETCTQDGGGGHLEFRYHFRFHDFLIALWILSMDHQVLSKSVNI